MNHRFKDIAVGQHWVVKVDAAVEPGFDEAEARNVHWLYEVLAIVEEDGGQCAVCVKCDPETRKRMAWSTVFKLSDGRDIPHGGYYLLRQSRSQESKT